MKIVSRFGHRGAVVVDAQRMLNSVLRCKLVVDGHYGHNTAEAVRIFQRTSRCTSVLDADTYADLRKCAAPIIPLVATPRGLSAIIATFGDPTSDDFDSRLRKEDFPLIGELTVNGLLVDTFHGVFSRLRLEGLGDEIETVYAYCHRNKMNRRGGELSTHSWGISVDINPETNAVGADGARVVEDGRVEETEDRVGAAVVQESESANLVAFVRVFSALEERNGRHAEHSDLLIQVAQVGNLQDLFFVLETRVAVGSEEPESRRESVATVASESEVRNVDAVGFARAQVEIRSALLIRSQRVVDRPHGVRR